MIIEYNATTYSIEMQIRDIEASLYPKSYKVWNSTCSNNGINEYYCRIVTILSADEVNKGKNESGVARIKKFVAKSIELFGNVEFVRMNNFLNDVELSEVLGEGIW